MAAVLEITDVHENPEKPLSAGGSTRRLIRAELILMIRDPLTLAFVFVFPIVAMLIIGGSFGRTPDESFGGVDPAHWYVASYLTVAIGATGLVTLPVHIASYRERGVLRRLSASGFPRWSFALAELVVGLITIMLASALLLAMAVPVYGIPPVHSPGRMIAGVVAGSVAFVSIGVLLGTVLRHVRSAAEHLRATAVGPGDELGARPLAGDRSGHRFAGRRHCDRGGGRAALGPTDEPVTETAKLGS
jgi:hypothetical protein